MALETMAEHVSSTADLDLSKRLCSSSGSLDSSRSCYKLALGSKGSAYATLHVEPNSTTELASILDSSIRLDILSILKFTLGRVSFEILIFVDKLSSRAS